MKTIQVVESHKKTERQIKDADDFADFIISEFEYCLIEAFDESVNDSSELIEVLGLEYEPANVLKNVDIIAYNMYLNEWSYSTMVEAWDELNEIGDTFPIGNAYAEVIAVE